MNGRPRTAPTAASSATSVARSATTSPERSTASRSRAAAPIGSTTTTPSATPPCCRRRCSSTSRAAGCGSTTTSSRLGNCRRRSSAIRRAPSRCSATTRTFHASRSSRQPDHGRPRRDARRAAERLQYRPPAAVLQHAVLADGDPVARQPHVEGSATTGANCARRRSMKAGVAAPTPSMAPTRGRRARRSISTGRASRRSCSACR